MKLPEPKTRSGLNTAGLLGVSVIVLVATNFLNPWWLTVGIFFTLAGIGLESKSP